MISLSGALLVVGALLLVVGLFSGAEFLYASIAVILVAAALLPLGLVRTLDRQARVQ